MKKIVKQYLYCHRDYGRVGMSPEIPRYASHIYEVLVGFEHGDSVSPLDRLLSDVNDAGKPPLVYGAPPLTPGDPSSDVMMLLTQPMRDEVALLACTVDIIPSSRVQACIDAIGSLFGLKRSLYHCLVGDCVSIRSGGSRWIMKIHKRVR